jgi:hypothetical protein
MDLCYDFEFLEDGVIIDDISIGMARADGAELYLINRDAPIGRILRLKDKFLRENVLPSLPLTWDEQDPTGSWKWDESRRDYPLVVPRERLADQVREFIRGTPKVRLWGDYSDYDHVCLVQKFGTMMDLPSGVPMRTNDIQQERERLGNPDLPPQPDGEHNALADARHNVTKLQFLRDLEAARRVA